MDAAAMMSFTCSRLLALECPTRTKWTCKVHTVYSVGLKPRSWPSGAGKSSTVRGPLGKVLPGSTGGEGTRYARLRGRHGGHGNFRQNRPEANKCRGRPSWGDFFHALMDPNSASTNKNLIARVSAPLVITRPCVCVCVCE